MLLPLVLVVSAIAAQPALAAPQSSSSRSPNPARCAHRKIHETFNGHGYMFTWEEPKTVGLQLAWSEAREFCRARCMDLVSLETQDENDFIKERIAKGGQSYIWTSGRKCNFKGCERPDLQPVSVYGWFWTGSLVRMPATTDRLDSDWSDTGGFGRPQPDDREHYQGGSEEECLAILNNLYDDGVHWHDVACKHRMPFICEDSDELLQILQRSISNSSYFDQLAVEKLAVFDDQSQKLIPPFPIDMHQKEESGLRSAQGSLVLASSDAVANAMPSLKENNIPDAFAPFAPVVPATQHTVMMVAQMPAIPIVSQDGKEDLFDDEKLGFVDRTKSK